jgi:hypothetical protein
MTDRESLFLARLLRVVDTMGHALSLTWLPGFWRICDAYDLSLGTPDNPENFPRRHGA